VPDAVGAWRCGVSGVVCREPGLTRAKRDRAGFGLCLNHGNGPAADQMLLLTLYADCAQPSTVFLGAAGLPGFP